MPTVIRRSKDRGHADHGWLRSFHTFSFADYYDPEHMGVGPLRVINEDTVAPGKGFGAHSHRDMEIVSYVLQGRLAHQDSLGHSATIGPGTIQRISAGSGIEHSEFNPSSTEPLHFLQIWIIPDRKGGPPRYDEATFDLHARHSMMRTVVTPDGRDGTLAIHQDVRISVAVLPPGESTTRVHNDAGRTAYFHVAKGSVVVGAHLLFAGDALILDEPGEVVFTHAENAEVLVFDLPST